MIYFFFLNDNNLKLKFIKIVKILIIEQYYEELQTLINDDKNEIISQGYREWKINQWNEILDDEFIKEFEIGDHQW